MRLVQWNVCGGFATKTAHLLALDPDVAVVCEVQNIGQWTAMAGSTASGVSKRVRLDSPKELAVLARGNWVAEPLPDAGSAPPWVLPVHIDGPRPFTVVAVWPVRMPGAPDYVQQLTAALSWVEKTGLGGDIVLAGDLNAPIPSTRRRFAAFDENAERLGLVNAYRHARGVEQHQSTGEATYFHLRKLDRPFHIDHVYVPVHWADGIRVAVGDHPTWVTTGLSDHVPVTVDIDPIRRARRPRSAGQE